MLIEQTRIKINDQQITQALLQIIQGAAIDPISASACATAAMPLPGQHWAEQGGTYAGIMRGDDGLLYHLIVGGDEMEFSDQPWGSYGKQEDGATSCWDGMTNTRALVESEHDHPAAQAIHQANSGNQFGDWYLPAQAELSLCRATVRHLFGKAWYWSSTQYSDLNAWYQSFYDGNQDFSYKDRKGRVRAVRRLIIQ